MTFRFVSLAITFLMLGYMILIGIGDGIEGILSVMDQGFKIFFANFFIIYLWIIQESIAGVKDPNDAGIFIFSTYLQFLSLRWIIYFGQDD